MKNVRQFMDHVKSEAGVSNHGGFHDLSTEHSDFWLKLTRISQDKGIDAEEVKDIDEATQLSDDEWEELDKEFQALPAK